MSKPNSKRLVRLNDKSCSNKHKIPKEFLTIATNIRNLDFVVSVGTSPYIHSNKKNGIKVIGFDDIDKNYIVKVYVPGFEQRLLLKIKGGKKDYHEKAIENIFY